MSTVRSSLQRWILQRALTSRELPPLEVLLWNGIDVASRPDPVARLEIRDPRVLLNLALRPDPGLARAYEDGRLGVEGNLLTLVEALFRADGPGPTRLQRLRRLLDRRPRSSKRRARRNIHHHYDLGHDFYSLWLDPRMVYTCGYFRQPQDTLEEAQLAKFDHVCRKLALRPGERVVEFGCGWGGLAFHMAEHYGVRVRAFDLSHDQIAWDREEAKRRGLEDSLEFVQDDYRNVHEPCDALVSVGMVSHIGKSRYGTMSRVIDRCLDSNGRGLIDTIGRHQPKPLSPWLEERIFPGAYVPSLRELMVIFESRDFAVLGIENLRLHYARTVELWLDRFEQQADKVEAMFDERFVRSWRLYLAATCATFRTGAAHHFQVLFSRADNNRIPWTSAGCYETR
jgi:cyclopropane-fatty-acyl-phospholipid synthase